MEMAQAHPQGLRRVEVHCCLFQQTAQSSPVVKQHHAESFIFCRVPGGCIVLKSSAALTAGVGAHFTWGLGLSGVLSSNPLQPPVHTHYP